MKESPCKSCSYNAACGVKCSKWKLWFSAEWRKVRRMFAELGYEVEVEGDATD